MTAWHDSPPFTRRANQQRERDRARQRALEAAEVGRVPRGSRADRREDEHVEVCDQPPPGWARSER